MQVLDVVESAQDGRAMANLARAVGISESEARAAARVILPELAYGLERNTLSRAGLADVVLALGQGHHERILETPEVWRDPRIAADGEAILRHILGSERRSEALTARAARASGLGEGVIGMLLPILAQLLMGAIAKYAKGGLGDILSRLPIPGGGADDRRPAPSRPDFETGSPDLGGRGFELPKVDLPGGGFPMPPIPGSDEDRGNAIPMPREGAAGGRRGGFDLPDAGQRPAGGYPMPPLPPSDDTGFDTGRPPGGGRASPFPLPGPGEGRADNPYGDLSDILRRGGSLPSGSTGSGTLWSIVRNVLGGALGFGKRGIVGWLIQLIVMRWGWRILQRILFRR